MTNPNFRLVRKVAPCQNQIGDYFVSQALTGPAGLRDSSRAIITSLMSLAPGQRLGPYEIVSPLGAGGMGEVYRARDTRLERTVALKILPKEFSCDPVRKQRFEQEAKIISRLNHPHICVLHDVGHQDGVDYLVMECVEGETLAKRLEKGLWVIKMLLRIKIKAVGGAPFFVCFRQACVNCA